VRNVGESGSKGLDGALAPAKEPLVSDPVGSDGAERERKIQSQGCVREGRPT
jgi:hypothetical protein